MGRTLINYTDRSGVIALGGTSQTAMPANPERVYLFFQNISDTDMWISFGASAVMDSPSILIPSGQSFPLNGFVSTELMSVICLTTAKRYVLKEA